MVMTKAEYVRYYYECECEGVIPLTFEQVNNPVS